MTRRLLLASWLSLIGAGYSVAESPLPAIPKLAEPGSTTATVPSTVVHTPSDPISIPAITTSESCAAVNSECKPAELLCNTCGPCGPAGKCWVRGEYFYWVASGNPTPALITGAPAGNPVTEAGRLGSPGTQTLFGGNRLNNDFRSGFRITAGTWLNCDQTFGIEGNFFYLGQSRESARIGGNGTPIVSRPFFNVVSNQQELQMRPLWPHGYHLRLPLLQPHR
jgi:Putative beta barrel porin-7 (BBP7)